MGVSQKPNHIVITPESRNNQHLEQLVEIYKSAYGDGWVGRKQYEEETLKNVSAHHMIVMDGKPAAAVDMNRDRIISIAVHPDFQGQKLGVMLFKKVAESNPNAWITISSLAHGMLSTVLNEDLNYELVEDIGKIEQLYRGIKGVNVSYRVKVTQIRNRKLRSLFRAKGIEKDTFLATYRPGSIHDSYYTQLIFQNRS